MGGQGLGPVLHLTYAFRPPLACANTFSIWPNLSLQPHLKEDLYFFTKKKKKKKMHIVFLIEEACHFVVSKFPSINLKLQVNRVSFLIMDKYNYLLSR